MTRNEKQFLIALVLGDGHLHKRDSSLTVSHSTKQEQYIIEKVRLINELLGIQAKLTYYDNGGYEAIRFRIAHPYLKIVRGWLYKPDKKIPLSLLRRLNDQAIAIWYMDDGSLYPKKTKAGKYSAWELSISTYFETEQEAIDVCIFFKERYDVDMTVKRNKGRFSVRCGTRAARILLNTLRPYCLKGMEYKFRIDSV